MRVVEFNRHGVMTGSSGALLSAIGWPVTRVALQVRASANGEGPASDDPAERALWHWLDRAKTNLSAPLPDVRAVWEREVRVAAPDVCVLIDGDDPICPLTELLELAAADSVVVAVSSMNGVTGPDRLLPATDYTATHAGGIGYYIPGRVADLDTCPPLGLPVHTPELVAGLVGALAVTAEVFGRHQAPAVPATIDVALVEVMASFTFGNTASFDWDGVEPSRSIEGRPAWPIAILRCSDGYVCLATLQEAQWSRWLDVLGNPDWGTNPLFADRVSRSQNFDALLPLLEEVTTTWMAGELARAAQQREVPCTPVNQVGGLLLDEHLNDRGVYHDFDLDGRSWRAPDLSKMLGVGRAEPERQREEIR